MNEYDFKLALESLTRQADKEVFDLRDILNGIHSEGNGSLNEEEMTKAVMAVCEAYDGLRKISDAMNYITAYYENGDPPQLSRKKSRLSAEFAADKEE